MDVFAGFFESFLRKQNRRRFLISSYSHYILEYSYFLAVFLAGAFFATFFAGAFFTGAAFFAGAFFAGMRYPPFHSAVAEDKKFTTRLTNEQSSNRQ